MDLDRLGQIERDALAPRQEHLLDDLKDQWMHRQPFNRGRPGQQRPETPGPLPVERALAQGCRGEARVQVRLARGDQGGLDGAPEPAPAVARKRSEERRVGKEWVSTCRYEWSQ